MWWTGLIEISFHVTSHRLHNVTWFCRCVILHCEFLQNCSDDVIIYLKWKIKVLVRWIFVAPGNLFSSFEKFSRFFRGSVISRGLTWVWPWDYCKELQKTRFDINSDFEIWSSKKSENSETTLARKNLHEKVRSKIAPNQLKSVRFHIFVSKRKYVWGLNFLISVKSVIQ